MKPALREPARKALWALVRLAHTLDFRVVLPLLARLPLRWGYWLSILRGRVNASAGRDWRSVALGFRHIAQQTQAGYRLLAPQTEPQQWRAWLSERFATEAREEFEAALVAAGRIAGLECRYSPDDTCVRLSQRERGLVLLTPHFDSFFLGVAFLARCGVRVNLMTSAVTHDPRVHPAVRDHFFRKYRGLERRLNGGRALDMEAGVRPFYTMLQRREIVVVLADAPALPNGIRMAAHFLGTRRVLAGGALRMARYTHSDLGGFVCRHLEGQRYRLELGPLGPATDRESADRVYRFLGAAIEAQPGRWWAADLLPALPPAEGEC